MNSLIKWAALIAASLLLTGCAAISPETAAQLRQAFEQMAEAGHITQPQFEALMAILSSASQPNWWVDGLLVLGSSVAAYFGIPIALSRLTGKIASRAAAQVIAAQVVSKTEPVAAPPA